MKWVLMSNVATVDIVLKIILGAIWSSQSVTLGTRDMMYLYLRTYVHIHIISCICISHAHARAINNIIV